MKSGKEHAFDQGYTQQQLEAAWKNGLASDNPIIRSLDRSGYTWEKLNPRCVDDLIKRYGVSVKKEMGNGHKAD
jgi:hypothetical protein